MQKKIKIIENLLESKELVSHDVLFELCDAAASVLENEKTWYRETAKNGNCGSLLNFLGTDLPLIVVPDIHARPFFIKNILNATLPQGFLPKVRKPYTVFEALSKGKLRMICVGDALHTERSTQVRWALAQKEFDAGVFTGPAITEEMKEGLNTICALMKLKIMFPEHFHFLKGNHENIMNANGKGDFAFKKYASEGYMVREFMHEKYGDDILYLINCVENALPLIAVTQNCVVSHAEPAEYFTYKKLVNARKYDYVVEGLTWTPNDKVHDDTALGIIEELNPKGDFENYVYLAGHRPVADKFRVLQNGYFIQIHNPSKQNIALVYKNRKFNPETDLINVNKEVEDE